MVWKVVRRVLLVRAVQYGGVTEDYRVSERKLMGKRQEYLHSRSASLRARCGQKCRDSFKPQGCVGGNI